MKHEKICRQSRACRYCGQIIMMEVSDLWTEEQMDELAVEKCLCPDAQIYNALKHRKEKAHEKIGMLFGEISESPIDENVEKLLHIAANAAVDSVIERLTVVMKDGTKAGIKRTAKGSIKIERSVSKKNAYEL